MSNQQIAGMKHLMFAHESGDAFVHLLFLRINRLMGAEQFVAIAGITITDLKKYLQPEQVEPLLSAEKRTDNRKLEAHYIGA